jgi:hypothetical protein
MAGHDGWLRTNSRTELTRRSGLKRLLRKVHMASCESEQRKAPG